MAGSDTPSSPKNKDRFSEKKFLFIYVKHYLKTYHYLVKNSNVLPFFLYVRPQVQRYEPFFLEKSFLHRYKHTPEIARVAIPQGKISNISGNHKTQHRL